MASFTGAFSSSADFTPAMKSAYELVCNCRPCTLVVFKAPIPTPDPMKVVNYFFVFQLLEDDNTLPPSPIRSNPFSP